MERMLRWFTQGVHHLYTGRAEPDARPTFERVDSGRLGAGGFHASASMGLHDDFAETMPAYVPSQPRHGEPRGRSFA
ncbi:MAG: hypothetical protein KIT60_00755 [Burkholderiaceae bacterium]|nr:hypothetical protein [Burkholderiaceae bacterium]